MTGTFTPTRTEIRELPNGRWVELPLIHASATPMHRSSGLMQRDPDARTLTPDPDGLSYTFALRPTYKTRCRLAQVFKRLDRRPRAIIRALAGRDRRKMNGMMRRARRKARP
jgi:hypothetical protein